MTGIRLEGITKKWGSYVGVDNQSLEIRDKEFLVLLGPSGCGKTTTMRMIAGLEDPTEGEIWIGDRMVNDDLPRDRNVAMVFQNYGLYPHMSVFDNIAYPLKVRNIEKPSIRGLVEKAAKRVELSDFLNRRPKELSGGQRQRVALARAIVRTPNVFLMDEPLSNLDAKLRVNMRVELKHLSHELKITTVYVTHDQVEAMTLADRVAVMNHGRIRQLGTPDEIYNNPSDMFVAGFIGSPAMNLIDGAIDGGRFATASGRILTSTKCGGRRRAVLGIRPEDIDVVAAGETGIDAEVYACEYTGESVLVTLTLGSQKISAKGERGLKLDMNSTVGLNISPDHVYLFDPNTEERIRPD